MRGAGTWSQCGPTPVRRVLSRLLRRRRTEPLEPATPSPHGQRARHQRLQPRPAPGHRERRQHPLPRRQPSLRPRLHSGPDAIGQNSRGGRIHDHARIAHHLRQRARPRDHRDRAASIASATDTRSPRAARAGHRRRRAAGARRAPPRDRKSRQLTLGPATCAQLLVGSVDRRAEHGEPHVGQLGRRATNGRSPLRSRLPVDEADRQRDRSGAGPGLAEGSGTAVMHHGYPDGGIPRCAPARRPSSSSSSPDRVAAHHEAADHAPPQVLSPRCWMP